MRYPASPGDPQQIYGQILPYGMVQSDVPAPPPPGPLPHNTVPGIPGAAVPRTAYRVAPHDRLPLSLLWCTIGALILSAMLNASLFLPYVTVSFFGTTQSLTLMSIGTQNDGPLLLTVGIVTVIFAVITLAMQRRWILVTTGVCTFILGILAVINYALTNSNIHRAMLGMIGHMGAGAILQLIVGVLLLILAVATLIFLLLTHTRRTVMPRQPGPPRMPLNTTHGNPPASN